MSKGREGDGADTDVAIIGMGCIFPKAPDLNAYWHNIVNKVQAIDDPPEDRLIDAVFDPDSDANDRIYCRRGGYIDDLATFDPLKYGIMPVSVEGAEPEHFLALKVADAALADAGFPDLPFNRERFDTILGRGTFVNSGYVNLLQHGFIVDQTIDLVRDLRPDLGQGELDELKLSLKSSLPAFTSETAPGLASSVMTGIIANRMNLGGRNFTVDAACASALIALENGIQNLLSHRCDAVLVGAVQISTPPVIHMLFTQLGALSRQPGLRPFDADADGTMLGEGIGMMVIKRLDDAIRDGHRIYAVVKGVASSSDGQARGLLAPDSRGQQLAMRRAYEYADVDPKTVTLIETHGTGIPLGDATEVDSMARVYGTRQGREATCAIGSVKSMIGHLIPAAGIAGLIKAALSVYHRTLPPTLNCEHPHAQLELENTPFYINTEPRPWISGSDKLPRRAGVNAFGFGGINTHAVLEEYPGGAAAVTNLDRQRDSELLVISAADRQGLINRCREVQDFIASSSATELVDLANALWQSDGGPARLAIVSSDIENFSSKLSTASKRLLESDRVRIKDRGGMFYYDRPLAKEGGIAFIFPGEGSQYVNMLRDLCIDFPEVRECFDVLDRAYSDHDRGFAPSDFIFPKTDEDFTAAENRIWNMDGAVDAVITADRAMFRLLHSFGVDPDVIVGHSSGEIMALEAAGAIVIKNRAELVRHIRAGNRMIENLAASDNIPQARLIAVGGLGRDIIDEMVGESEGSLCVAMENCPHQFVICCDIEAADRAIKELTRRGGVCQTLAFDRAYHSRQFEAALGPLQEFFDSLPVSVPAIPMYSCLSAARVPDDIDEIRRLALMQWARPVRFRETIENMYRDGVRLFVEIGPRSNLTGFVSDILAEKDAIALASNTHRRSGITQLHHLLGHLYASGVSVQLDNLYRPRQPREIDLDNKTHDVSTVRKEMDLRLGMPRMSLGQNREQLIRRFASAAQAQPPGVSQQQAQGYPATRVETAGTDQHASTVRDSGAGSPDLAVASIPGPGSQGFREEAMNQYLDTMETFLQVQHQTMHSFLGTSPEPGSRKDDQLPLAGEIEPLESGNAVRARRSLELGQDLFLRHHTLGGGVSQTDPGLLALPVMPLSMALEIMAQVASVLFEGAVLTEIRSVRMLDWVILQQAKIEIETEAGIHGNAARVQLYLIDSSCETGKKPVAEGDFVFASTYPTPGAAIANDFEESAESPLSREDIYPAALFHGPAFRAITSLRSVDAKGIVADLTVPPKNILVKDNPAPRLISEPVLLDAVGQAVGLWSSCNFDANVVVFPAAIDEIRLYGPAMHESAGAQCRVRTRTARENPLLLCSDADVLSRDERVHISVRGLQHRRVEMPVLFHHYRGSRRVRLTSDWEYVSSKLSNGKATYCCRTDKIAPEFWKSENFIWRAVLAFIILGATERQQWLELAAPEKRKTEWLLGRLAAKEAICGLINREHGIELWPADVEISSDEHGKPFVSHVGGSHQVVAPSISISHSHGIAAAIAMPGDGYAAGLDFEYRRKLPDDLDRGIMSDKERAMFDAVEDAERDSWKLRLWCAKEAAGKALGRGLMGAPKNLVARSMDFQSGMVQLELTGSHARLFPQFDHATIPVRTFCEDNYVAACAVCAK